VSIHDGFIIRDNPRPFSDSQSNRCPSADQPFHFSEQSLLGLYYRLVAVHADRHLADASAIIFVSSGPEAAKSAVRTTDQPDTVLRPVRGKDLILLPKVFFTLGPTSPRG